MYCYSVHNITRQALLERSGNWKSVWKRFDRLSKAGVFEAFDQVVEPFPFLSLCFFGREFVGVRRRIVN